MSTLALTRRLALAAFGGLVVLTAVSGQNALAQTGLTFRNIRVDVAPLRANAGDPTATWVQRELPAQLARALAGRMAPNGATLTVRIDYLTLGSNSGGLGPLGSSYDNIQGVAIINGAQTPIRATSTYDPMPQDQAMIEQSNYIRVSRLVQVLCRWIAQGAFF